VTLPDRCLLTFEALDLVRLGDIQDPSCGALASFVGLVRNEHQGRPVLHLDYEAHEGMALKELFRIAEEAHRFWNLGPLVLAHRLGRLQIGDAAVLTLASAAHRDDAFTACRFLIDEIKLRVPVWKREFYADGTQAWVGAPGQVEKGI